MVLSTTEIPAGLETVGDPIYIQSCVSEMKSEYDTRENDANNISGRMPFIELRLYNQLIAKMNALNCNAVFGIQVEMEVSCCAGLQFMLFTSFISYSLTSTHSHHITSSLTSLTSHHIITSHHHIITSLTPSRSAAPSSSA